MAYLDVRREEAAPFGTKKNRTKDSCYAALWVSLAIAFAGEARAWTGQPLAYVTSSNGISVIDTGDNKVVDTIPGPALPAAVTPDGKHLYAFASDSSDLLINISVIDTSDDQVVATVPLNVSLLGEVSLNEGSHAIAVSPDGKQVYVTTGLCSRASFDCVRPESVYYAVWMIDTATNKVSAVSGKGSVEGIAFSPDGQHAYFANYDPYALLPQVLTDSGPVSLPGNGSVSALAITPDGKHLYVPYVEFNGTANPPETVAIIDTTMHSVQTLVVEPASFDTILTGVCVTPDGRHVYVTNQSSDTVSVIDTASNTIVKTVSVGARARPSGVAITPDGLHVYVSNQGSDSVSVIDTTSNTVVDTILSVMGPSAISIMSRPLGVPFLVFEAKLEIDLDRHLRRDVFELGSSFILNRNGGNGIHPDTEAVKLQVGPFMTTIPAGSFKRGEGRSCTFEGVINGVYLRAKIELIGGFRYTFRVEAKGANLRGTINPVQVSLGIGNDSGLTSIKAHFDRDHHAHGYWTDESR